MVNVAEIHANALDLVGYGYMERASFRTRSAEPAELAHSLAVNVERLRVCSPHPIDALFEFVAERNPGVLVFGPDRSCLRRRTYQRAVKRIRERSSCLVWLASD